MELLGVGAAEALLVLVVMLIVVGPHRFPEIARQGGRWYKVARRYAAVVTADVRGAVKEIEAEIEETTEDLREVRDLGEEMTAEAAAEVQALNVEATQLAAGTEADLNELNARLAATMLDSPARAADTPNADVPDESATEETTPPAAPPESPPPAEPEPAEEPAPPATVQRETVLEIPRGRPRPRPLPVDPDADSGS
jgi:sec-independent protein translocase protein TatB